MLTNFLIHIPLPWFIGIIIGLCVLYLVLPPRGLIAAGIGHAVMALYGVLNAGNLSVLPRVWILHLAGLWLLVVMGLDLATDDPELPPPDDDSVNARATRLAYELVERFQVAAVERSAALGHGLGTLLVTSLEEVLRGYDQSRDREEAPSQVSTDDRPEQTAPVREPPRSNADDSSLETEPRPETGTEPSQQEPNGWENILADEDDTTNGILLPSEEDHD